MKYTLPTRKLPANPDLDRLRRQAKELLRAYLAGASAAVAEVNRFYTHAAAKPFALHHAQLVLARSYGFESWSRLKAYVDGVTIGKLVEFVRSGDVESARAILRVRPELVNREAPGSRGYMPLHYAVMERLTEMVRVLMRAGADPHAGTAGIHALRQAASPLGMAVERGYDEIAAAIREEQVRSPASGDAARAPERESAGRESKLAAAARAAVIAGDLEWVRAKAAEVDLVAPQDERGWLLGIAVEHDRPEMVRLLLELGLDPDARVRVGDGEAIEYTWGMPLYHCARNGKHGLAEILLAGGADPNAQVYASGTPLSEAYGQGDAKMVSLLERYGGQSNASMAGLYRRPDLAKRLLEKFGDTPLPDDGFSSGPVAEQLLGAAARGGDAEILRMAMERARIPDGDPRWNGLLQAPLGFFNHWIGPWCHPEWDRSTYLTCFRMILQRSGAPNAPLNSGATILHQIVAMGDHVTAEERVAFAAAALDAGACMDLRDDLLRSTPLGWACRWGREELVRLFLERGADVAEAAADSWATPLAWAEKMGHRRIAELLRQRL